MPIATSYTNPTGERNAIASFKKWLETQAPTAGPSDFTYAFTVAPNQPTVYPRVAVSESIIQQPGSTYLGMKVFNASTYPVASPATDGTLAAILVQIDIQTDAGADTAALRTVYKIRDRIKAAIMRAGIADDSGTVTVAACEVLDFQNAEAPTGIILRCPTEQDAALQEAYLPPDVETPNIHTIRLLVRLEWFELN